MKMLKAIAIVIAVALAVLLIPNLRIFDEQLDPEISRRIAELPIPPAQGNAALYLYGLPAAEGKSPMQVGTEVIKLLQKKRAQDKTVNLSDEEYLAIYGGRDLDKDWRERYDEHCNVRADSHCLEKLLQIMKDNPVSDSRLLGQLKRYQELIRQPHFIEDTRSFDFNSPLPDFHQIWLLGRITTAQAFLTGTSEEFIASTQRDMDFWRLVLRESQTYIGKMVAMMSLHKNLLAISYVLKQEIKLNNTDLQALNTLLPPLDKDELDICEMFTGDLRFGVENRDQLLKSIFFDPSLRTLVLTLMTQASASVNHNFHQTYLPAYNLCRLSAPEFYLNAQRPISRLKLSRFNPYNLGAKIQTTNMWWPANSIGRPHDINGIYSLVRMQLRAVSGQNADQSMTLKALLTEPEFRNPYTQQLFDLDSTNRQLSFKCFEARNRCAINY